ncbi:cytochrome P450 [Coprinopsis marcescibilis]|uniref:Cytochrome P450 n=1 Tax=Coprinopsis marcescibilis TaxID=230819 RepID=A0A5C3L5K1_COPMA|nr:cytochrome P450 [Coprinopsis marcescibilis]
MTSFLSFVVGDDLAQYLPSVGGFGLVALAISVILLASRKSRRNPRRLPYPPGPRGYPIIGNLLDVPPKFAHKVYNEWSLKYGDMIYLNVLGKPILVLNSLSRIEDLLETRSALYSDRPKTTMLPELMGWNNVLPCLNYGPRWRLHRKTFAQFFTREATQGYRPLQIESVQRLISRLLKSQDDVILQVEQHMSSLIARLVYSIDIEENETYLKLVNGIIKAFEEAAIPGRFLVDVLPILKYIPGWMPGAEFQRFGQAATDLMKKLQKQPFELVQEKMLNGKAETCIVSELIDQLPPSSDPTRSEMEAVFRQVASIAHIGGADTSYSAMRTILYAMASHQDIQRRAQAEIDREVEAGRPPTFDDCERLPFVNAIVKECLRWISTAPFGFPHALSDEYDGYFIPKGTIILPNTWAIQHNESLYGSPFKFDPDRFLDLSKEVLDPVLTAFGYGRRMCPAYLFALDAILIFTASILATFDIQPLSEESSGLHENERTESCLGSLSSVAFVPGACKTVTPYSIHPAKILHNYYHCSRQGSVYK